MRNEEQYARFKKTLCLSHGNSLTLSQKPMSDGSQLALNTCRHDLYRMLFFWGGVGILTVCCVKAHTSRTYCSTQVTSGTAGRLQSRRAPEEPHFYNGSLSPLFYPIFVVFFLYLYFLNVGFYACKNIAYLHVHRQWHFIWK